MKERAAEYRVRSVKPLSKSVLLKRACCHRYTDHRYRAPTGLEIESLLELAGWTQNDFADVVGVTSSHKGSATIRRWKCDPGSPSHRTMPYSAWRLALYEAGLITVAD